MVIARYDPFLQLRHQLFHQHFDQPLNGAEEVRGTTGAWSPLVDIFEEEAGITLKVELPEVDVKEVDLHLEGNALMHVHADWFAPLPTIVRTASGEFVAPPKSAPFRRTQARTAFRSPWSRGRPGRGRKR